MILATKAELQSTVKELRQSWQKESQPALKKRYQRNLATATRLLNKLIQGEDSIRDEILNT